ncbi:hypothetical protein MAHJHV63_55340 [Mycobacterium avium subsp. hominissuis]
MDWSASLEGAGGRQARTASSLGNLVSSSGGLPAVSGGKPPELLTRFPKELAVLA